MDVGEITHVHAMAHGCRGHAAGKPPAKAHVRIRRRNRGAVRPRPRGTWSKTGRVKALDAMEMIFFFVLCEKMTQNGGLKIFLEAFLQSRTLIIGYPGNAYRRTREAQS